MSSDKQEDREGTLQNTSIPTAFNSFWRGREFSSPQWEISQMLLWVSLQKGHLEPWDND